MGLLLSSVWRAGCWAGPQLRIWGGAESPIDLTQESFQQLKPRLHELARRGLARHLSVQRPEARASTTPLLRR